ncbi:hypothetical protein N9A69_02460 [Gammaproteobacteria bacterium]|nr:hypothetical protein [Gammaproteobacteria bacterium]MDA7844428.1 hypothetical protein [Gammaproteobacteria bacterium]
MASQDPPSISEFTSAIDGFLEITKSLWISVASVLKLAEESLKS